MIPQLLAKDGELAAWMIGELRGLGYTEVNLNPVSYTHLLFVRYRLKNCPCAKGQMRTRQLSAFVLFLFTNSTLTPKYPFCNLKEYSECK